MRQRSLRALGVLIVSALVFSGGTALARPSAHAPAARPAGASQVLAGVKWTPAVDMPFNATRFDAEYEASADKIYILGFRTDGDATDGSVWYYDEDAKTFVDTGVDMPVPVSNYEIAALTDKNGLGFYIFGGRDANATVVTTTQVYYPDTNTVAVDTKDPWPGLTPLGCVSLPATGVAVVHNEAVVMGGLSFSAAGCSDDNSAQTWVFDPKAKPGHRWTQGPDLHVARGYIAPAVLDNTIYAVGGDINDPANPGTLVAQTTVESWKPFTGRWNDKKVADLPEGCDESQAFGFKKGFLANSVVLTGCGQWPNALGDTLQYDVAGNAWAIVGELNTVRRNQAAAETLTGKKPSVLVLGGYGADSGFIDPIASTELGKGTKGSDAAWAMPPRGATGRVSTF